MGIRYSYDDFTTKGHGVIEGYYSTSRKSVKRKNKSTKVQKSEKNNDFQSNYKHLDAIHRQAVAERKYQAIDHQTKNE